MNEQLLFMFLRNIILVILTTVFIPLMQPKSYIDLPFQQIGGLNSLSQINVQIFLSTKKVSLRSSLQGFLCYLLEILGLSEKILYLCSYLSLLHIYTDRCLSICIDIYMTYT